ncbi:9181_t:CDS:10 [Gigaspora margarita]|uniref:9181_t:CDS:1 n=1 Tax=Gigaspora margarita TaxID=4874 RepID=A0ABM8W3G5_GIGMA|nr:9181_t:CDS:10 [Gigaspora margarita]
MEYTARITQDYNPNIAGKLNLTKEKFFQSFEQEVNNLVEGFGELDKLVKHEERTHKIIGKAVKRLPKRQIEKDEKPPQKRGRKPIVNNEVVNLVRSYTLENKIKTQQEKVRTQNEITNYVYEKLGIKLSQPSICVLLKKLGIAYKKLTYHYTQLDEEKAKSFNEEIKPLLLNNQPFIALDECSFYPNLDPRYGYALKSERAIVRKPSHKGKHYTLLFAIKEINPVGDKRNILIMDNARIHTAPKKRMKAKFPSVEEQMLKKNMEVRFITTYAPMLNATELAFCLFRQQTEKQRPRNFEEMEKAIEKNLSEDSNCYKFGLVSTLRGYEKKGKRHRDITKTALEKDLINLGIVEHNLQIVKFTLNNLPFQVVHSRITSNLLPLAILRSFDQEKMNYELVLEEEKILSLCQEIKVLIAEKKITVSMHPSPFVSLAAAEEITRKNSQAELIYHAKILELISKKAVITIHLNSKQKYGISLPLVWDNAHEWSESCGKSNTGHCDYYHHKTLPPSSIPESKSPDNSPTKSPLSQLSDEELEKCLLEDFSRRLELEKYFVFNLGKEVKTHTTERYNNLRYISGNLASDMAKLATYYEKKAQEKGIGIRGRKFSLRDMIYFVKSNFKSPSDDEFERVFFEEDGIDDKVDAPTTKICKSKNEALDFLKKNDPILKGKKTIESRFSQKKIVPYGQINVRDVVLMKKSGGNVLGEFTVKNVLEFEKLNLTKLQEIKAKYGKEICSKADQNF